MPPITELSRIEPVYLARLEKQGMFTTGILLEVSETPTRRPYLADHVTARSTSRDVARRGADAQPRGVRRHEHQLFIQGGIEGLHDLLAVDLDTFRTSSRGAPPSSTGSPRPG